MEDAITILRESAERMVQHKPTLDEGAWVVIAVLPTVSRGLLATPMLGGFARFSMRRFNTAEEAIANSVAMPAAKAWGGWVLNIETGQTMSFRPFQDARVI
jgi:hypothetical protein